MNYAYLSDWINDDDIQQYSQTQSSQLSHPITDLNWETRCLHKIKGYNFISPYEKYNQLVSQYGYPDYLNPDKSGCAVWSNIPDYPFIKKLELRDEQCYCNFPYQHISYIYTTTHLRLPYKKLHQIIDLYSGIMYDRNKKNIIIRGPSVQFNIAVLALICKYKKNQTSWYKILDDDLFKKAVSIKNLKNRKIVLDNIETCMKYV